MPPGILICQYPACDAGADSGQPFDAMPGVFPPAQFPVPRQGGLLAYS